MKLHWIWSVRNSVNLRYRNTFCVTVFSGTIKARTLKLGIHRTMSDCNMGLRIRLMAFILPIFVHFLSFSGTFVSQFSQALCKLESSNVVYTWRMSNYILGSRFGLIAHILTFLPIFLSFPMLHVKIEKD